MTHFGSVWFVAEQPVHRPTRLTGMRSLVVALMAILMASCGIDPDTPGQDLPPRGETTPTVTPSAADEPTPAASTNGDTSAEATPRPELTFSGPPKIGYVDGSVLRLPDGTTVQLPDGTGYSGIARYAGGYLVATDGFFEGTVGMHRLGRNGESLEAWSGTGSPLVSGDGRVAWVSLIVAETGETGPTLLHVDSVTGGEEVTQEIDRTTIPFLTGWFRGQLVYETWGDASSFLTDLVDEPQAIPRAEYLGVPNPDGSYSARHTTTGVEFLHADGQPGYSVRDRGLTRTVRGGLMWEDNRNVLTTLVRGERRAVVRISRDGEMSLATPWRKGGWPGFAFLAGE